eukprot:scaffold31528_cov28-Tisochrysis_lutea.AAC.3
MSRVSAREQVPLAIELAYKPGQQPRIAGQRRAAHLEDTHLRVERWVATHVARLTLQQGGCYGATLD